MFAIQKMIDSRFAWLFAVCILPLCLAVLTLSTAASPTNPAARAGHMIRISSLIDDPDILFPKPPPPPPPAYQRTAAMEQTA